MCPDILSLLIHIIILAVIIGLIRLLLPWVFGMIGLGEGGILMQAVNIIIWGAIAILVCYIIFELFSCLLGSGGLSLRHL